MSSLNLLSKYLVATYDLLEKPGENRVMRALGNYSPFSFVVRQQIT